MRASQKFISLRAWPTTHTPKIVRQWHIQMATLKHHSCTHECECREEELTLIFFPHTRIRIRVKNNINVPNLMFNNENRTTRE